MLQLWHSVVYKGLLLQQWREGMWQLDEGEMWVGDQPWHCSYLKTENKDKLTHEKKWKNKEISRPPHTPIFFFPSVFLKHKHRRPTQQQHTGEGAPAVSAWRDIMPQCQSDVQANVIGECEKDVISDSVSTQTRLHTHKRWCKSSPSYRSSSL